MVPHRFLVVGLVLTALLVALLVTAGGAALARDAEDTSGPTPDKNFSNIHADIEWVVTAFEAADAAQASGDLPAAIRHLQEVVDTKYSRESPGDAAPYVVAVHGRAVFEGAWIVARHRLASWGDRALAAYAGEFGATARTLLERAARRNDEATLAEVATRFLPLPAGRRACLLLIDLALERGDVDAALGLIESLEDLEAVTAETKEALAPWRAARIRRQAVALARSDTHVEAVRAILEKADPRDGLSIDAVGQPLRRRAAPPSAWPTSGGDTARSAVPKGLGKRFRLRWFKPRSEGDDLVDSMDPAPKGNDRPSIWLPPRAVTSAEHLFVSDGEFLHIYRLRDGSRALPRSACKYPRARPGGIGTDTDEDRRKRFGLLEGHALTVHAVTDFEGAGPRGPVRGRGRGWLVLSAVPDGNVWPVQRLPDESQEQRNDHIQAQYFDGRGSLETLWRVGGTPRRSVRRRNEAAGRPGLPSDTRLYGAPAVYGGKVWVAGVRPSRATTDRWEAWVYALDPGTGKVLSRTHLGTGTPMRNGRMDEVIPTSPAAAHGRIVVGTALGILGAVDARDGRVQWIYRYDRSVETERGVRRNRDRRDEGNRAASFCNEPPVLALDRCFLTPTDSEKIVVVFNRPRTTKRSMMSHGLANRFSGRSNAASQFLVEHIAGVVPGRGGRSSSLLLVGKGDDRASPGPIVVSLLADNGAFRWPEDKERESLWQGASHTGFGAEPYGRALVTEDEVFVPTEHGIVVYEIHDRNGDKTHYLGILNREDIPDRHKEPPRRPYGNLIAVPGQGLVSVSATTIAFWERIR